jgi:hypothetical protein
MYFATADNNVVRNSPQSNRILTCDDLRLMLRKRISRELRFPRNILSPGTAKAASRIAGAIPRSRGARTMASQSPVNWPGQ